MTEAAAGRRSPPWIWRLVPAKWLVDYRAAWLPHDAVAGVTLAAYAIPVSLAYAGLAGLPPQAGLYGYLLGGLGYALLGSSRQLAVGPTSAISLMIAGTVGAMADGDAQHYAQIASLAAFTVALLCALAWGTGMIPLAGAAVTGIFPITATAFDDVTVVVTAPVEINWNSYDIVMQSTPAQQGKVGPRQFERQRHVGLDDHVVLDGGGWQRSDSGAVRSLQHFQIDLFADGRSSPGFGAQRLKIESLFHQERSLRWCIALSICLSRDSGKNKSNDQTEDQPGQEP